MSEEPCPDYTEEPEDTSITELLDIGYQQLDRYIQWSESSLRLDTRTAQQDVFNAESLLDFLANAYRKAIMDMNEYELRWFVFSHYIRKAMADVETEERLLSSLNRFFGCLAHDGEIQVSDWMRAVLDETTFYNRRRAVYHALNGEDEREWKTGFAEWCTELADDLDSRCLLLPNELSEGLSWADARGWREATLFNEANERWQRERDELLAQGMNYEQMRDQLALSFKEWLDTPQDRLDAASPLEVIQSERADAALDQVSVDDDDEQ